MPRYWLVVGGLLVGCHTTPRVEETRPEPPVMPRVEEAKVAPAAQARGPSWEGTIRLSSDEPGAHRKVFQGVWLEGADGTRRVLTYESDSPFHALCDQPVRVTGHLYRPEGQALINEHLQSHELRATAASASLAAIGERRTMRGQFEAAKPGETSARFVEAGAASHLVHHIVWEAAGPVPRCSKGAPLRAPEKIPASQPVEIEAYAVSTDGALAQDAPLWVMSWKHVAP